MAKVKKKKPAKVTKEQVKATNNSMEQPVLNPKATGLSSQRQKFNELVERVRARKAKRNGGN